MLNSTPPLDYEAGPVVCGRCRRHFDHLMFETIEGILQLRCGNVLVAHLEANCLHCGWTFHHNARKKDVEKMSLRYGELLRAINPGYLPE